MLDKNIFDRLGEIKYILKINSISFLFTFFNGANLENFILENVENIMAHMIFLSDSAGLEELMKE